MKKVTFKKEVVNTIEEVKYQANDGTMFNNENDCKIYEQSYLGLLKAEYAKMEKIEMSELDFFKFTGNEDYIISIIKVNTDKDVETLLKLNLYFSAWLRDNEDRINEIKDTLEKSKGGKVIVGRGYMYDGRFDEEIFSILASVDSLIDRVKNI